MKLKDWIGPVLAVLVPLAMGGIHLEMSMARVEAKLDAQARWNDRVERWIDNQSRTAAREAP